MAALSFMLLCVAAVAIPLSRRTTGDFFSPAALVVVIWGVTLGLYFLELLPYKTLSSRALLLLLSGLASLIAGVWAGERLGSRGAAAAAAARTSSAAAVEAERWVILYSAAGLLGFLWYVGSVVVLLGWSSFLAPARIRWSLGNGAIPSGYLFLEFFCIIAPLVALGYRLSGTPLSRRAVAAAVLCAATLWVTTDRTHFFLLLLTVTWMILLRAGREMTLGRAALVLIVAGTLLLSNFLLVGAWLGKTPENLGVELRLPGSSSTLALETLPGARRSINKESAGRRRSRIERVAQKLSTLYLYSTGSYAAFSALVQEEPDGTAGAHTFYPILRALSRAGVYSRRLPEEIPAFRLITREGLDKGIEFNGYTFLYYAYNDFGEAGVLVVPVVIGAACGFVYGRLRRRRAAPVYLLLAAQAYVGLMLSIFVNRFNNTASWYIAFWSVLPFVLEAPALRRARLGRTRAAEDLVA